MEREPGLGDSTGLRGSDREVLDTDEGSEQQVEQAQVECVDVRPKRAHDDADGEVGDSATWGKGNCDVDAAAYVPALMAAGGKVAPRAEQIAEALVDWGADTVSVAARLTQADVQEAMVDAHLEHRKGHIKAILVAVKGIDIVRKYILRMRRCSGESVWNSAAPSVSAGPGRYSMARYGDFSESPPRAEDNCSQLINKMGPVQQADSNDGAMDGLAKHGEDMYDEDSDNMAGVPVQEFVQVENQAGMIRLPKQQAVLRGDSVPPAKQGCSEQEQVKARNKKSHGCGATAHAGINGG